MLGFIDKQTAWYRDAHLRLEAFRIEARKNLPAAKKSVYPTLEDFIKGFQSLGKAMASLAESFKRGVEAHGKITRDRLAECDLKYLMKNKNIYWLWPGVTNTLDYFRTEFIKQPFPYPGDYVVYNLFRDYILLDCSGVHLSDFVKISIDRQILLSQIARAQGQEFNFNFHPIKF